MNRPQRSPSEVLEIIRLQAEVDAIAKETLAKTDEEIERELVAAGFDLEALRRTAAEQAAELRAIGARTVDGERSPPKIAPLRARWPRTRWIPLLVAAVLALAVLPWIVARRALPTPNPVARHDTEPTPTVAPSAGTPEERAAALRNQGFEACDAGKWDECKELLDRATDLDGQVATQPNVMKARGAIDRARPKSDAGRK